MPLCFFFAVQRSVRPRSVPVLRSSSRQFLSLACGDSGFLRRIDHDFPLKIEYTYQLPLFWQLQNYQNFSHKLFILILLYTRTTKSVSEAALSLQFRHFRSLVSRLTGKIRCKLSKSNWKMPLFWYLLLEAGLASLFAKPFRWFVFKSFLLMSVFWACPLLMEKSIYCTFLDKTPPICPVLVLSRSISSYIGPAER